MTRFSPSRDGYLVLAAVFVLLRLLQVQPWDQSVDAYAYWSTRDGSLYDEGSVGRIGAYLYSPAYAVAMLPLVVLPWPMFVALWTAVLFAALWLVAGRFAIATLLFIPVPFEIVSGNVHLLYAVVAVFGTRYPALWAIPLITKVVPGIGLLWFVARGEWRQLALALGAVTALIVASLLLFGLNAWTEWIAILSAGTSDPVGTPGWYLGIPLAPRLVAAALLVWWGARTDRRWVLPVAMLLALPVLWLNGLAVLAALAPALAARARRSSGKPTPRSPGT